MFYTHENKIYEETGKKRKPKMGEYFIWQHGEEYVCKQTPLDKSNGQSTCNVCANYPILREVKSWEYEGKKYVLDCFRVVTRDDVCLTNTHQPRTSQMNPAMVKDYRSIQGMVRAILKPVTLMAKVIVEEGQMTGISNIEALKGTVIEVVKDGGNGDGYMGAGWAWAGTWLDFNYKEKEVTKTMGRPKEIFRYQGADYVKESNTKRWAKEGEPHLCSCGCKEIYNGKTDYNVYVLVPVAKKAKAEISPIKAMKEQEATVVTAKQVEAVKKSMIGWSKLGESGGIKADYPKLFPATGSECYLCPAFNTYTGDTTCKGNGQLCPLKTTVCSESVCPMWGEWESAPKGSTKKRLLALGILQKMEQWLEANPVPTEKTKVDITKELELRMMNTGTASWVSLFHKGTELFILSPDGCYKYAKSRPEYTIEIVQHTDSNKWGGFRVYLEQ